RTRDVRVALHRRHAVERDFHDHRHDHRNDCLRAGHRRPLWLRGRAGARQPTRVTSATGQVATKADATFGDYVSADSHVTEPPEVWSERIDPAYRDRAPVLRTVPGQGATIVIDPGGPGEAPVAFGRIAAAGRVLADDDDGWSWEELHPGGYDPAARID